MGFGNRYGEPWNADLVIHWVKKMEMMGIQIIALSDTVGVSNPVNISQLFGSLIPECKGIEFGAHLHSHPDSWAEKVESAWLNGCRRFDSAMRGIGGCPMADDDLVGNLATERLVGYFAEKGVKTGLDALEFNNALKKSNEIFTGIL